MITEQRRSGKSAGYKKRQKRTRQRRVRQAGDLLSQLQERAKFDGFDLRVSDSGRHWEFRYGGQSVLSFWPSTNKATVRSLRQTFLTTGLEHAYKLAVSELLIARGGAEAS